MAEKLIDQTTDKNPLTKTTDKTGQFQIDPVLTRQKEAGLSVYIFLNKIASQIIV